MQMTFLTLLLGLVSGSQSVTLAAGPEVAAIELLVDGRTVAHLAEPPWQGIVDFGHDLLPHHLVARGLDGANRDVALAEQWINLPRPPAEVEIVIETARQGRPRAVRLAWQSLAGEHPGAVSLTLDGKPLALDAERRAELPRLAGNASHLLSAELRFGAGLVARKDVALGGEYGEEVATELTAFAVRLRKGKLPPPDRMQGWFTAAGKPLRVSAVEAGAPHLFVVRDLGAIAELRSREWFTALGQERCRLSKGEIEFLSPLPQAVSGPGIPFELFPASQEFDAAKDGIPWLLSHVQTPSEARDRQQLADAVAVAALQAEAGSGPRAVLLVVAGGVEADRSRHGGAAVRRFLAAIHVPLFVWQVGEPDGAVRERWGAVQDISSWFGLASAFHTLERELEAQRLVLVEGRHLPQSILLSPAASAAVVLP